jgi:hypothetical protein
MFANPRPRPYSPSTPLLPSIVPLPIPPQVCTALPLPDRAPLLPQILDPVVDAVGAHRRVGRVASHGLAILGCLAQHPPCRQPLLPALPLVLDLLTRHVEDPDVAVLGLALVCNLRACVVVGGGPGAPSARLGTPVHGALVGTAPVPASALACGTAATGPAVAPDTPAGDGGSARAGSIVVANAGAGGGGGRGGGDRGGGSTAATAARGGGSGLWTGDGAGAGAHSHVGSAPGPGSGARSDPMLGPVLAALRVHASRGRVVTAAAACLCNLAASVAGDPTCAPRVVQGLLGGLGAHMGEPTVIEQVGG